MNKPGTHWCHVAVLVTSVTAASCSVFTDKAQSQWRTLTVINVQPRAEVSADVDARCVGPASVAPSDEVVVVKYRVGRAPYLQALPVPSGRVLHEGDTVVVHPGGCRLEDGASAS